MADKSGHVYHVANAWDDGESITMDVDWLDAKTESGAARSFSCEVLLT